MSITVSQLTKLYGEQKAVNQLSFTVGKGEVVGFLGPNGAGKSTTMKIITGYLEADTGEVTLCGEKVSTRNLVAKSKTGYLPEANPLYYEMYVREYLEFIAGVHGLPDKKKAVAAAIDTVKLQLEANKKIGQLSKGYKQRVGIAAALIHDPEVLILDEPTSGLDPNQIIEIREVIRQLGRNKTVLFSSHILQEVEAICDRVIIINRGNLVADDRLSNLRSRTAGGGELMVEFREAPAIPELEALPHASRVESIAPNSFRLLTNQPEALKKELLQLSLNRNLSILSLQEGASYSLEDIFRELTGNRQSGQ
jgi:ABC-2 type transport system ATP-binding protein